jgi:hypothetical protein
MYTLRIIDQTTNGGEKRRNIYLGKNYDILMKVEPEKIPESQIAKENVFNQAIRDYYNDPELIFKCNEDGSIDSTIVGFIYAETITPIRNNEVVYIVNNEGKTVERVYGIYQKY